MILVINSTCHMIVAVKSTCHMILVAKSTCHMILVVKSTCHMILDYDYREVFVFGNILQKVALSSRRTVSFLPVHKISSLKITPPKTPNSGQFSYPLPNIVSFLFEKNRLEFRFRSCDSSFKLFPVWQPFYNYKTSEVYK
jgi:hypothetical protein